LNKIENLLSQFQDEKPAFLTQSLNLNLNELRESSILKTNALNQRRIATTKQSGDRSIIK